MTLEQVGQKLSRNHTILSELAKLVFLDIYKAWQELEQINKLMGGELETYVCYPRTRIQKVFKVSYSEADKAFFQLMANQLIREERLNGTRIVYINFDKL